MINQLVNQRYEVVEKVGDSPLFAVYKARDTASNRIVAIKSALPPYATDPEFLAGLQAGLNASANLNHPNITHLQEFSATGETPYAAVEFVRGINLKERIRRIAPFTLSVAIDFACAIGEALHYAHSLGQPHGDLRPHNIIISPEGAVKVTDFGVQRAIARSAAAQQAVLLRVAPYHAPELSIKQPGTVSGDIYALGTVLYEMLTGTPLYAGETPEAIADQHAFAPIPSPRLINTGVPRSIEGIVLKCLQKRPDQRYLTAAELLNDLKSVRDALRFGKPLSWSPIDIEKLAAESATPVPRPPAAAPELEPIAASPPTRLPEPVADVAASSQTIAMPAANNRLRSESERVSIYLRAALVSVTVVIIITLIGFVGVWSSMWVVPKSVPIPQMVGKPIDEVRKIAEGMKVRLIEHAEYGDRPRNIVYKTNPKPGEQTRNKIINVWYSRGSTYVDVPNLVNLSREDAEQKLKDAGLVVGRVVPEYHNTVQVGHVIRQTVSPKKRIYHDTPVDLVISDGPRPEYAINSGNENDTPPVNEPAEPDNPPAPSSERDANEPSASEQQTYMFERQINIPTDGRGQRRVRIEYQDALGSSTAVIDEEHEEGDKIPVSFAYYGKEITLTIYYNDTRVWQRKFDPQKTRSQRLQ